LEGEFIRRMNELSLAGNNPNWGPALFSQSTRWVGSQEREGQDQERSGLLVRDGRQSLIVLIEEKGRALEVDEAGELFGFFAGAFVDLEGHLAQLDPWNLCYEGWVGDAKNKASEPPPLADELHVFDFSIGHREGVHLSLAPHEDIPLEPPVKFDVSGEKADLAQNLFATQGAPGRDVKLDVDGIDAEHGDELRAKRRVGTQKSRTSIVQVRLWKVETSSS